MSRNSLSASLNASSKSISKLKPFNAPPSFSNRSRRVIENLTSVKTPSIIRSISKMFTMIILLILSIMMIISLCIGKYMMFGIILIIFASMIIFHYAWVLILFSKAPSCCLCDCTHCYNVCSIISRYWFAMQTGFCSTYNLIIGILMFIHGSDYVSASAYLMLAISIPLPLICLKLYSNEKKKNGTEQELSKTSIYSRTPSYATGRTDSTKLLIFMPLRENGIKYGTCMIYTMYTACYILLPALHWEHYNKKFKAEHGIYGKCTILRVINQLFFRSFVGMLLFQTIFAFLMVLLDPRYQFLTKKWQVLKALFWNKKSNQKKTHKCMYLSLVSACIALLSFDTVQAVTQKKINLGLFLIDWTVVDVKTKHYLPKIADWLSTGIHIIGIVICFIYLLYFHAIQNKKRKRKDTQVALSSFFTIPKAFAIQSTILILLCSVDMTFLYFHMINDRKYEIIRQISMLSFMFIESCSIYFLISIRNVCKRSFDKDNWKANGLKRFYYQIITAMNIYDFVYLSIFKMIYYHQNGLDNEDVRLSYAFSFSSLTLLTVLTKQLLISYGQWKGIIIVVEKETSEPITSTASILTPPRINSKIFIQKNPLTKDNLKNHESNHDSLNPLDIVSESASLLTQTSNEPKIDNHTKISYTKWKSNHIVNWIESLENGKYKKYSGSIRTNLKMQNILGKDLMKLDKNDLHELGVKRFHDKQSLLEHIKRLNQK